MTKIINHSEIKIRAIKRHHAEQVGMMAKEFARYLRNLGDNTNFQFNAKAFLRDGFGRNRALYGLIAEVDGMAAGYCLYHDGYDTDKGIRIVYLADLYVRPEYRRCGVGRKLIEEVKTVSKKRGAQKILWTVFAPNKTARKFYWNIGARYRRDMLEMKLPLK